MKNCHNKIGLAFTGDSEKLKLFFLNYSANANEKNGLLNLLKHEIIKGKNYYCFVEEKLEWHTERELECKALCRAADEEGISFYFCYFDTGSFKTTVKTNRAASYFDSDVYGLFAVSATAKFQDKRYPTFKDWMKANFQYGELENIMKYGIASGFKWLIYCPETLALYEKYHTEIFALLKDERDSRGYKTILDFIVTFNRADIQDDFELKSLLVWHAAEKLACEIVRYEIDDEIEY